MFFFLYFKGDFINRYLGPLLWCPFLSYSRRTSSAGTEGPCCGAPFSLLHGRLYQQVGTRYLLYIFRALAVDFFLQRSNISSIAIV